MPTQTVVFGRNDPRPNVRRDHIWGQHLVVELLKLDDQTKWWRGNKPFGVGSGAEGEEGSLIAAQNKLAELLSDFPLSDDTGERIRPRRVRYSGASETSTARGYRLNDFKFAWSMMGLPPITNNPAEASEEPDDTAYQAVLDKIARMIADDKADEHAAFRSLAGESVLDRVEKMIADDPRLRKIIRDHDRKRGTDEKVKEGLLKMGFSAAEVKQYFRDKQRAEEQAGD